MKSIRTHESTYIIWHKVVPLKVNLFVWCLFQNQIPTTDNLLSRGLFQNQQQLHTGGCGSHEDINNLFSHEFLPLVSYLEELPSRLEEFLGLLTELFGKNVYDVKYMIKHCNELYDSLERVAKSLQVSRAVGNSHQAGSDSLLTWLAFDKMVDTYFINNKININKYAGVLFGLELTAA